MGATKNKMDQFCRSIADSLHIGLMATYTDGIICYMNATFAKMFGFDRQKAIGDTIRNYFPEAELLNVINSEKKQVRVLFRFNGIEAFISRYPVFVEGICIGGYVEAYFRDIQDLQVLLTKIDTLEQRARYFERRAQATLPGFVFTFNDLVGVSASMVELKQKGIRFASSNQPVLVTGESGTGKELIANALHAASRRSHQVFVTVNCAAIPAELMEAELFGYEDGAFTGARRGGRIGKFELADGGTIFLDEIAEMPLNMQAKLLRVLENREIQKIGGTDRIFPTSGWLRPQTRIWPRCSRKGVSGRICITGSAYFACTALRFGSVLMICRSCFPTCCARSRSANTVPSRGSIPPCLPACGTTAGRATFGN